MADCDLTVIILCVLCLVVNSTSVFPGYDDYNYDDEIYDDVLKANVSIITHSEIFSVKLGESVILPCRVSHPSEVLLEEWQHGKEHLFGDIEHYYDLKVNVTTETDAGVYTCCMFIPSGKEISVSHTIVIFPKVPENTTESSTTDDSDQGSSNGSTHAKAILTEISESISESLTNEDVNQHSSTDRTHILTTTQKFHVNGKEVEAERSYSRFGLLSILSETMDNNLLSGMSRSHLAQVKSSASSLGTNFWIAYIGIIILKIIT